MASVLDFLGEKLKQGINDVGNAIGTGVQDVGNVIDTGAHDVANMFNSNPSGNVTPVQPTPIDANPIKPIHVQQAMAMMNQQPMRPNPMPNGTQPQAPPPPRFSTPIVKPTGMLKNPIAQNPISQGNYNAPKFNPQSLSGNAPKLGRSPIPMAKPNIGVSPIGQEAKPVPTSTAGYQWKGPAGWVVNNMIAPTLKAGAQFVNQGVAEGQQLYDTGRMEVANLSHNPVAFRNANQASQNNYANFNNNGGLGNVGTITTANEAKQGNVKGAEKIIGDTAMLGSWLIPGGGKLAEDAGVRLLTTRLGEQGVRDLAAQLGIDTSKMTVEDTAKTLMQNKMGQKIAQKFAGDELGTGAKLLHGARMGSQIGGTFGAGSAMGQGGTPLQVLESGAANAGLGALAGTGGEVVARGLQKLISNPATHIAQQFLQDHTTPQTLTELESALQDERIQNPLSKNIPPEISAVDKVNSLPGEGEPPLTQDEANQALGDHTALATVLNPDKLNGMQEDNSPDMKTFVNNQSKLLLGSQDAYDMVLRQALKESGANPAEEANLQKYGTDLMAYGKSDVQLSPREQHLWDKTQEVKGMTRYINALKKGIDPTEIESSDTEHQPQIAESMPTKFGDRKNFKGVGAVTAKESNKLLTGGSSAITGGEKAPTDLALEDGQGNRILVRDTPDINPETKKIEGHNLNVIKGDPNTKFEHIDKKSGQTRLDQETETARRNLRRVRQAYNSVKKVYVKGGDIPHSRFNEVFNRLNTLIDKKNSMGLEFASEEGRINKYADEMKTWKKAFDSAKPTRTNQAKVLGQIEARLNEMEQTLNRKISNFNGIDLTGQTVKDTDGKVWQVKRASNEELTPVTGVQYSQRGVYNVLQRHLDSLASYNRVRFMQMLQDHPEFDKNFVEDKDLSESMKKKFTAGSDINPLFQKYWIKKDIAGELKNYFKSSGTPSVPERLWQGLMSPIMQSIVFNPLIHGQNLAIQGLIESGMSPLFHGDGILSKVPSGPIGMARYIISAGRVMGNPEYRSDLLLHYLMNGGHVDTYGGDMVTTMSKITHGASNLNRDWMSGLDTNLRLAAYDQEIRAGANPMDAVNRIDKKMGSRTFQGAFSRQFGMFWHWTETQGKSIIDQVFHPLRGGNLGANFNTVALIGAMYAFNKVMGGVLNNKNFHSRTPGELGMLGEIGRVGKDIYQGVDGKGWGKLEQDSINIADTKINPLVTGGIQQIAGKDLYTQQPISGAGNRLYNLSTNTLPEAQYLEEWMAGKKSLPEIGLNATLGIYTPHAKGDVATTNKNLGFLNTKNAKIATPSTSLVGGTINNPEWQKVNDPTGYQQEQAYYATEDYLNQHMIGGMNKTANQAYQYAVTKNQLGSGKYQVNSPSQQQSVYEALYANPLAAKAYADRMISEGDNDPLYKSSLSLQTQYYDYMRYPADDPNKTVMLNENPQLQALVKARSQYFATNPFNSPDAPNPDSVAYPTFTGQQATQYNYYEANKNNWTAQQKATYFQNNPLASSAEGEISAYYNKLTVAQGGIPTKAYQNLTPSQQVWWNHYSSLPAKTGAKTAFINTNPQMFNTIQNIMAQNALLGVAQEGQLYIYQGTPMTSAQYQSYLKNIYTAGKYDIARMVAMNGQPSYSLNPALAYSQSSTSSSSKKPRKPIEFAPEAARPKKAFIKYAKPMYMPRKMQPAAKITLKKGTPLKKQAVLKKAHI